MTTKSSTCSCHRNPITDLLEQMLSSALAEMPVGEYVKYDPATRTVSGSYGNYMIKFFVPTKRGIIYRVSPVEGAAPEGLLAAESPKLVPAFPEIAELLDAGAPVEVISQVTGIEFIPFDEVYESGKSALLKLLFGQKSPASLPPFLQDIIKKTRKAYIVTAKTVGSPIQGDVCTGECSTYIEVGINEDAMVAGSNVIRVLKQQNPDIEITIVNIEPVAVCTTEEEIAAAVDAKRQRIENLRAKQEGREPRDVRGDRAILVNGTGVMDQEGNTGKADLTSEVKVRL